MELYSTNKISPNASLQEAVLKGLPADNGLYMPKHIPKLPPAFFKTINEKSFIEIAYEVSLTLFGDIIARKELQKIVTEAFDFSTPLVHLKDNTYVLELFHGPTHAFKDYGARFMSRLMSYFLRRYDREINILVATSGDTGGAVGYGFLGVEGVNVTILYPKNKVSEIQEKQLTTIGGNVTTVEVDGNFDDCQKLVKKAFLDEELSQQLHLTSANSINISRLIPQSFYYFYAYAQRQPSDLPLVFSVPSGNFGNLSGGLLAYQMGLPVYQYIASTNVNDIVPHYLSTGLFEPKPSVRTISNAMDVGNPSNFPRMLAFFDKPEMLNDLVSGYAFTDDDTRKMIKRIFDENQYIMCPHTAIAYLGLKKWSGENQGEFDQILLSTAHPAKFMDVVEPVIDHNVEIPGNLKKAMEKVKNVISVPNKFEIFKDFLLNQKRSTKQGYKAF